jgi:nucleosome binding factor SPN SPT16 subunit
VNDRVKELFESLEKGLAALKKSFPPYAHAEEEEVNGVLEFDVTLPEADIGGLHFKEYSKNER